MSWVSGIVSANMEDSEALGPSWSISKASDAVICSESLTNWQEEQDRSYRGTYGSIRHHGDARTEPDLPTGAWKLKESGGTDMVR